MEKVKNFIFSLLIRRVNLSSMLLFRGSFIIRVAIISLLMFIVKMGCLTKGTPFTLVNFFWLLPLLMLIIYMILAMFIIKNLYIHLKKKIKDELYDGEKITFWSKQIDQIDDFFDQFDKKNIYYLG